MQIRTHLVFDRSVLTGLSVLRRRRVAPVARRRGRRRPVGVLGVVGVVGGAGRGRLLPVLLVVAVAGLALAAGAAATAAGVGGDHPSVRGVHGAVAVLVAARAEPRVPIAAAAAGRDVVDGLAVGAEVLDLPDGLGRRRHLLRRVLLLRPRDERGVGAAAAALARDLARVGGVPLNVAVRVNGRGRHAAVLAPAKMDGEMLYVVRQLSQ